MPALFSVRSINDVYLTATGGILPTGVFSSSVMSRPSQNLFALNDGFVTEDLSQYIGSKGFRFHDRSSKLILVAAKQCLEASAFLQRNRAETINVVVGSDGALKSQMDVVLEAIETPQFLNPKSYPNRGCNVIAGQVSLMFGLRGESTVLSAGYRSGTDALIYASRKIENGGAPYLVAAGEALSMERKVRTEATRSVKVQPMVEGAVSFTLERVPHKSTEGFSYRVVGYAQFSLPEQASWKALAEDFLNPFGVDLSGVDFICGQEGRLEISAEREVLDFPFDLLGCTSLVGLAGVLLVPDKKSRYVLLVESSRHQSFSLVLLSST